MADISNELHDAVDTILLSYATRCGMLPSSNTIPADSKTRKLPNLSKSAQTSKGITRTTNEVLNSLKRPQQPPIKTEALRNSLTDAWCQGSMPENSNYNVQQKRKGTGVWEKQGNLDTKCSMKDSFGKVKVPLSNTAGEVKYTSERTENVNSKAGSCQQQALELSSDASSAGGDTPEFISEKDKWLQDVNTKSRGAYTEEIEGWKHVASDRGKGVSSNVIGSAIENFPITRLSEAKITNKAKGKASVLISKSGDRHGQKNRTSGQSSKYPQISSDEPDLVASSDAETKSNEVIREEDFIGEALQEGSDDEEPPVLPRQIVRRKLDNTSGGNTDMTGRAIRRPSRAALKKQKLSQMDSSLLKKLELYKWPANAMSII